jgi:hypothetical protein
MSLADFSKTDAVSIHLGSTVIRIEKRITVTKHLIIFYSLLLSLGIHFFLGLKIIIKSRPPGADEHPVAGKVWKHLQHQNVP